MLVRLCIGISVLLLLAVPLAAAEPLEGYLNYEKFAERVQALGKTDGVKVSSYGKSGQGRELFVIEFDPSEEMITVELSDDSKPAPPGQPRTRIIVTPPISTKPAWVVVGSIQPDHPLGSELALRMAEELVTKAGKDEAIKALLKKVTLFIIPRPDPDGLEKCFDKPLQLSKGNGRKTDDDRDFSFGEDPAEDLNKDGMITLMRVEDESSAHRSHPDDPRVMFEIDSKKKELAQWRILSEGVDNDGDEQFNEDGSGGVSLNRNFTFHYPPFQPHSGPNAVSESESRDLAKFLFDRTQIAGVLTFTSEDNLFHPWKHDGGKDKGNIRNTIAASDESVLGRLAEEFRELHGGKDCPGSPTGNGSFAEWAYFHFGRWSFASRGWWVPKVEEEKKEEPADGEKREDKPAEKEKRGAEDFIALRWLAKEKIDGFVDWKAIEHPGFPGKKVEVGGFKPFVLTQPPVSELDGLASKHLKFLTATVEQMPELALVDTKIEPLGGKTFRITTNVVNRGQIPTAPEMGVVAEQAPPIQVAVDVHFRDKFLLGSPRMTIPRLKGQGDKAEKTWIIRFNDEVPEVLWIRAWAVNVGLVEQEIKLPK